MVVDIGGVRKGVSELLHAVCTKPLDICCISFASILNLNFGFPNIGRRGAPMVMGLRSVRWGVSDFL